MCVVVEWARAVVVEVRLVVEMCVACVLKLERLVGGCSYTTTINLSKSENRKLCVYGYNEKKGESGTEAGVIFYLEKKGEGV